MRRGLLPIAAILVLCSLGCGDPSPCQTTEPGPVSNATHVSEIDATFCLPSNTPPLIAGVGAAPPGDCSSDGGTPIESSCTATGTGSATDGSDGSLTLTITCAYPEAACPDAGRRAVRSFALALALPDPRAWTRPETMPLSIPATVSSDGIFGTLAGGSLTSTVAIESAQGDATGEPRGVTADYEREVTITGVLAAQLSNVIIGNVSESSDTGCGVNFESARLRVHFLQRASDVEPGRSSGIVCN